MKFLSQWLLTILLLVPLGGAIAIAALRRRSIILRRIALGTTLAAFALSLLILVPFRWRQALSYDPGPGGSVKLALRAPLALGMEYHVAVDGLSFPFLVFTTLMFPLLMSAWWQDQSKAAGYFVAMLALEFSLLGIWISFDFVQLYVFMGLSAAAALALLQYSSAGRGAVRMTLGYLLLGMACLLVPLIALRTAGGSFDLARFPDFALGGGPARRAIFIFAASGLLIRMAVAPMHSWLMTVVNEAPHPTAIAIAVLLPITGVYGLVRLLLPLFPPAAGTGWGALAILGIVSIFYGALCAMGSDGLKSFVAYSMTSVMGFVLLAVSLGTPSALDGAVILLIGQGLVAAMLLVLGGTIAGDASGERTPLWTAFFGAACLAWLTVPVMFGQILVVSAAFETGRAGGVFPEVGYVLAIAASLGVLAGGAAAARLIRRVFQPAVQASTGRSADLTPPEITVLSVLGVVAILLGIIPGVLCFTFTHPAARALLRAP